MSTLISFNKSGAAKVVSTPLYLCKCLLGLGNFRAACNHERHKEVARLEPSTSQNSKPRNLSAADNFG